MPEFQYSRFNASADPARYPVAARVARQVLCLPIYPVLAMADVERICGAIHGAFDR
ncbi:DegT/DnrJ/EryC1/StrS family aminotransferase [Aphanothece stagnina]|uniref:DegT/DnrJ/EryC1/StrS family aminotransferase n=1 Tax=Aphanothece stagnina TaxID=1004305 RepID=UPI00398F467F